VSKELLVGGILKKMACSIGFVTKYEVFKLNSGVTYEFESVQYFITLLRDTSAVG
jgi:hypothetical protein